MSTTYDDVSHEAGDEAALPIPPRMSHMAAAAAMADVPATDYAPETGGPMFTTSRVHEARERPVGRAIRR